MENLKTRAHCGNSRSGLTKPTLVCSNDPIVEGSHANGNLFRPPLPWKDEPRRIAIYCRSIVDDHGQLQRQRSRCKTFAAAHFSCAAIDIFEDVGRVGSSLMKLRCKLFKAYYDAVIVQSEDCLPSEFHALQAILARLFVSGTRLFIVDNGQQEFPLVRHVLWGAVARLDDDERLNSIGPDWWHQSGEFKLSSK